MRITLSVIAGPHEGREFSFVEHDNFIVGRGTQTHFRLPLKDRYFSRIHFMVEVNPPSCRLMDMQSKNGTRVNGEFVKQVDLNDGDVIQGGGTRLRVNIHQQAVLGGDATIPPRRRDLVDAPEKSNGSSADLTIPPRSDRISPGVDDESNDDDGKKTDEIDNEPKPIKVVKRSVTSKSEPATVAKSGLDLLPDDYEARIQEMHQPIQGYRLVEELGSGSMGTVYLAISDADESVVALKTIRSAIEVSRQDLIRFSREASILKSLSHPGIVAFYEMGESLGTLFFAMEYVPGQDASELMYDNEEGLSIERAVGITCQMLDAISYAHKGGFVHRDIKPSNLMLASVDGRDVVKVADFGLARQYQASKLSGLTLTGDIGGTASFMPPEQITNYRDSKPTVDQYAAAATLYYLLTKQYVYDLPEQVAGQLMMILQKEPISIAERRADIPQELADVIHRSLNREPGDRYADVAEMRDALSPFYLS